MNKTLKFKQTENEKVWISTDFHFNHNPKWPIPIWKSRGFSSVSEMNESIIESINNNIRPTDHLIYLGDFVLNCSDSEFEMFLSKINCQNIWMLFGNHNSRVYDAYKKVIKETYGSDEIEVYPARYRNVIFIGNYAEVIIDGKYVILSHFPMHSWNYMKQGSIHLFGHLHCNNSPENGKQMDCGWDKEKRPYSINEIFTIMKDRPIISDGGHH